ncbi:hepatic lectin isoform X1 [Esox lucius]|uniref:C-type lectin domain-containing protein n=1 Tax=Esox lucius TaxID=8010 RepID=A0A6Q2WS28_ESOLU|nr:hepatic lectin isoform X1 [Esox lucius]
MENIYANVGVDNIIRRDTKIEENNINSKDKRNHIRCAAVCLGLLCVLLLAAIIGVCVHYNNVTHEFQKGQTLLQTERDELQTERDQLQSERNKLKTERDQLQSERNKLKTERDQLLTERNGRRNKMNILERNFKLGWIHFQSSLYLFSTVKKTWEQSRQDCQTKSAYLVIINNQAEQNFIHGLKERLWIGLFYQEKSWKWVDGTSPTKEYWAPGEPNNNGKIEHCAERRYTSSKPEESWNDNACNEEIHFLCEKAVGL